VKEALLESEPFTYFSGGDIVWFALSSLTDKIDTLSNPQFLGKNGKRTMFHISTRNAVNIKDFSAIPSECEWLLLPGMALTITGVSNELGEDLTVVSARSFVEEISLQPTTPKSLSACFFFFRAPHDHLSTTADHMRRQRGSALFGERMGPKQGELRERDPTKMPFGTIHVIFIHVTHFSTHIHTHAHTLKATFDGGGGGGGGSHGGASASAGSDAEKELLRGKVAALEKALKDEMAMTVSWKRKAADSDKALAASKASEAAWKGKAADAESKAPAAKKVNDQERSRRCHLENSHHRLWSFNPPV
jgi:hypothetical protein